MKKFNFRKEYKNNNLGLNNKEHSKNEISNKNSRKEKLKTRVSNIEIKPQFLVIGLVSIITVISLIYFIFLKYSPIMNFKYEGYGISGKQITENLLGDSSSSENSQGSNLGEEKNVNLTKIEEQGTIFKKLNSYFIGSKEKTEIDLKYPIYINDKNTIYNLSQDITLISKNFEQIAGYPNISITDGKVYNGNNLERADSKEYIFAKTEEGIYINLKEIKISTTANEYVLPVNSLIVFEEDVIRYYSIQNNILMFNEIKDVDYNSQIIIKNVESNVVDTNAQNIQNEQNKENTNKVDKEYNYEELLTRLGIIENAKNDVEKEEIQKEDLTNDDGQKEEKPTTQKNETTTNVLQEQKPENNEQTNAEYIKPEVTVEDFKAEVYTVKSNLNIKDPKARIIEAPTFEIYKDGKIYLRRVFKNSGEIQITGLVPETEYEIIGKYIYLNAENKKVENTFYKGTIKTKGYEALGTMEINKEEGEIYSNKIQIKNVKIISDLQNEAIKGINQIELETGNIKTVLKNNKVNELLEGKEVTIESSEGLKSNTKIEYAIKFYDKNGKELKVKNNKGKTRTSKKEPKVNVKIKEQDIVSVTLGLKLTNKDNVKLENYKYIITRPNGEKLKEERLSEDEKEIKLEDLDQNQYYKIKVYADYDLSDNKGIQKDVEIGNLVFATKPISTLGSLEMIVENKELTSKNAKISYKIDEDKTDKRLIQILNELTIKIVENNDDNKEISKPSEEAQNSEKESQHTNRKTTKEGTVIYTNTLTKEEIKNLQLGETKEINYENLKSNTKYTIEITGNVELGNTKEEVPVTYIYKEFTTLKIPAKVEIKNQFVTGNLIDLDVRVEDEDKSVLNNKVRMELRDEKSNLIDLQEIETNKDWLRKTYEKLEENKTYKLSFYADQYNEGSTDETYKVNYLIKEIEILTEPGISGSIGLTELTKKATGKNLVDISSEIKWYVYPNFYTNDYYGKEYNEETEILTLGGHGNYRRAVYDLREYAGQEVTMSFKAKAVSGSQIAYIQNSKKDANRTAIQGLTTEWKDYQYTLKIDSTGYLGFFIYGGNGIEVKELQIELGNRKTNYEEFKYTLQSNYSIKLEDKRDEITTNDYYIKIYEDNNLVKKDRYEEIPEENVITNAIKMYEVQARRQYKVELTIKIKEREYVLSSLEYNTKETEEIKGIYTKEDFLEIQPRGNYIVLNNIDLSGAKNIQYRFGNSNLPFEGKINFNGYTLTRDFLNTTSAIFHNIGEKGIIENINLNILLNNEIEKSYMTGLFDINKGKIENIIINLIESNNKLNKLLFLGGFYNGGTINKFVINYEVPIYGVQSITGLVYRNENNGIITNGYVIGENIKAVSSIDGRHIANISVLNMGNAVVKNIYTLVGIDTEGNSNEKYIGHITSEMDHNAILENVYSVGLGNAYNLNLGPNTYYSSNKLIKNSYYFNDKIFQSPYNQKTTKLALWDTNFQNEILNSENAFDVDNLVEKGFYPQIDMPECMPKQKYIELPEVEDKDLPDILSTKVLENNNNIAKVQFIINNPSGETITNIKIKNLECKIESQEYSEGKSKVIAILNNPIICVSEYSVMSISTKGAYNQEYTRKFKEKERLISIDFYREIYTTDDWKAINKSTNENYILMQDLDFKNNPKDAIIYYSVIGKINGNNHIIQNVEVNSEFIILGVKNGIKNIKFENISLKTDKNSPGIINTANKIENVHANNIIIDRNRNNSLGGYTGGLVGFLTNEMKNCSINNITIIDNSICSNYRIGGLVGVANRAEMYNCFATNVNMHIKNGTYKGVGGLIGSIEVETNVKNCYASGKIEIDGDEIGGLIGLFNAGSLENSYSYVNITGNIAKIGGLSGNSANNLKIKNTITLGDLYTSKINVTPERVLGNRNLTNINYAYANQRLNGIIKETAESNVKLLTAQELLNKNTYINLDYNDAFDYSELENGILPKLYKINEDGTYSKELLPNQEDIYLDKSNEFKIDSINIEKSAVDQIAGQVVITNTKEAEVTGLEIDGMDVNVTNVITRNEKSYINITAKPNKFYDIYKITKVRYKEEGKQKEKDVEGKVEVQFFKELYTFEDWQTIDRETYQNYILMNDIDFKGKTHINLDVGIGRLKTNGDNKTLKNINIENVSLIRKVENEIENINFENINILSNNNSNNIGVISNLSGNMNNINCKDITIKASNTDSVGIVGINFGNIMKINMENVNILGKNYVGGLTGISSSKINDVTANKITIRGKDYTGGIVGELSANIENVNITSLNLEGNNYVGGIIGNIPNNATIFFELFVNDSEIHGNSYVGGIEGKVYGYGGGRKGIYNSNIIGKGNYIGGITGNPGSGHRYEHEVKNCNIKGIGIKSNYVGGLYGENIGGIRDSRVTNCTIEASGDNVGCLSGSISSEINRMYYRNYVEKSIVKGNDKVGGAFGKTNGCDISNNYINAEVIVKEGNVGGLIGYLNNSNMTSVNNKSVVKENYFVGNINGNSNVGGLIGNIAQELYMPELYCTSNYIEARIQSESNANVSLGIGNMPNQNQYLNNTYFYKYSSINEKNPDEQNEIFIQPDKYLEENDLKRKETYTNKLNWKLQWNYNTINFGRYPTINSVFDDEQGIPLPKDEENIIYSELENNTDKLLYSFNYNGKNIRNYGIYSVIQSEDGSEVIRKDIQLYAKDGNLYGLPVELDLGNSEIKLVERNFIIDSYNGTEYETVLGIDGKLYDLKEPLRYPENFVNNNIESIGNNLDYVSTNNGSISKEENLHEVQVTYKNGDKVKFNYQTGEIISSIEEKSNKIGLLDYLQEKISEIGNTNSGTLQRTTSKYEKSKVLQSKLEKVPVEEALKEQSNNTNKIENITNGENDKANNSLKEKRYISIYDAKKDDYQIYQEEELLDTSKQEVVSENEKIEANNLKEYYASEGKSKNKNMGILWITLSIVGVVIILFAIKKRD